eukprot:RCo035956
MLRGALSLGFVWLLLVVGPCLPSIPSQPSAGLPLARELFRRLLAEKGLTALLTVVEQAVPTLARRVRCQHLASRGPRNLSTLCIEEAMLDPDYLHSRMTFQQFTTASFHPYQVTFNEPLSLRFGGGTRSWPVIFPKAFWRVVDGIQESHDRFLPQMRWRIARETFLQGRNRSLWAWNLNPGDPDLGYLRQLLYNGSATRHFFLLAHIHDRLAFP